jgi:hypothetical protein
MDPDTTLVFLHIPKTGGATLRTVLERQFRPGEIYVQPPTPGGMGPRQLQAIERGEALDEWDRVEVTDEVRTRELAGLPRERLAALRLVEGHFLFGVHEALPGPSTYVTLLRDPVERILSLYDYRVRRQGLDIDLERYVGSAADLELRSGQTWLLARPGGPVRFGTSGPDMLASAKRNLTEHFAVVGITERFDETLALLGREFGWRRLSYLPRNVSAGRIRRTDVPAATLRRIEELNRDDLELYAFAAGRFEAWIRAEGPGLARELRRQRRRNLGSRIWPLAIRAWERVRRERRERLSGRPA